MFNGNIQKKFSTEEPRKDDEKSKIKTPVMTAEPKSTVIVFPGKFFICLLRKNYKNWLNLLTILGEDDDLVILPDNDLHMSSKIRKAAEERIIVPGPSYKLHVPIEKNEDWQNVFEKAKNESPERIEDLKESYRRYDFRESVLTDVRHHEQSNY